MSIGKRTSDNGVDVHGKRFSTCTVASSYLIASFDGYGLAIATGVPNGTYRRWTGATPPFRGPRSGGARRAHVHASPRPSGGSLPSKLSLREGGGAGEEFGDRVVR